MSLRLLPIAIVACVTGCGEPATYPVRGKVVFPDGTPLASGGVVLLQSIPTEGQPVTARGVIGANGVFELTTFEEGDGAVPGKHRALVRAKRDADDYLKRGIYPRPVIHPRFESYETSDLRFTVQTDQNEFVIVVERPR